MSTISNSDFFTSSPIHSIKNTGYYKQRQGWRWESRCDYACLYCVERGEIDLFLNGENLKASEGDVIFLKSSDSSAVLSAKGADASYYFLSFYYDEGCSLEIDSIVKKAAVIHLFKEINKTYHSEAYLYRLKVAKLFLEIIHHLAQITISHNKSYSGTSGLRCAAEYVNTYYYKKITVEKLCKISNYSPAHLRRLFIRYYGMTPLEYVMKKKIDMAERMLLEDRAMTVEEIAEHLSICSASYLCKLFKERHGITITEYVQRCDRG